MMNSRKIIDENRISWNSKKDQSTLSYNMIFDDRPASSRLQDQEEEPDIGEILAENNRIWEERLRHAREEVYEAGIIEGEKKGYERANSELDLKLKNIDKNLQKAHHEWQERQKMLDPGVLDLAFELAESILEIPVENTAIRERMESELGPLLQRIEESSKPVLWISETDHDFISALKEEYASGTSVYIRVDNDFNPGEYKLESSRETIVHTFKTMLQDLKKSLTLPSWTP